MVYHAFPHGKSHTLGGMGQFLDTSKHVGAHNHDTVTTVSQWGGTHVNSGLRAVRAFLAGMMTWMTHG
jgi:hypothetical protein